MAHVRSHTSRACLRSTSLPLHSPEFLSAFYGDRWRIFEFDDQKSKFVHATVLFEIPNTTKKFAEVPFGYVDPFCNSEDPEFIDTAIESYANWSKEQNIVCEMLRLDPTGKFRGKLSHHLSEKLVQGQRTANLRTPTNFETYFKALPPPTRRMLKSAQKTYTVSALKQNNTDLIESAARVYKKSIDRVGGADKWRRPSDSFAELMALDVFEILVVVDRRTNELVGVSGSVTHAGTKQVLLIGNKDPARFKGAGDLLYLEIVRKAVHDLSLGRNTLFVQFGGGRSLDASDSLLRFKSKYSLKQSSPCTYLKLEHDPQFCSTYVASSMSVERQANEPAAELYRNHFPCLRSEPVHE